MQKKHPPLLLLVQPMQALFEIHITTNALSFAFFREVSRQLILA